MTMMAQPDYKALANILDKNRSAVVSDAHWDAARAKIAENAKRLEAMENVVTREQLDKPFTI